MLFRSSLCPSPCLPLTLPASVPLPTPLSLSLSISVPVSLYFFLSVSHYVSLPVSLSRSPALSLPLSLHLAFLSVQHFYCLFYLHRVSTSLLSRCLPPPSVLTIVLFVTSCCLVLFLSRCCNFCIIVKGIIVKVKYRN